MKTSKFIHSVTAIATSLLLAGIAHQAQAQGTIKLGMTSALTGPWPDCTPK